MSARRLVVAAFGDAGHAFPAIALARALRRRGHDVLVETWERWRDAVEAEGLRFAAAEEYQVFPPPAHGSSATPSAADAALALAPLMRDFAPDVVISDILTVATGLAAERAGIPTATLIPHVYPVHEPGMPFFGVGSQPPRTGIGRAIWRTWLPLLTRGLERGRREMNQTRANAGLPPLDRFHGGISPRLAMVGTFPHLEYPRHWPDGTHVTGPMEFEVAHPPIELPGGDSPLVLVAPSTAQDPGLSLVRTAIEALAEEPLRVVATTNRPGEHAAMPQAANAIVVDWLSYSQVLPEASLVICHGGHGTLVRALGAAVPVLCCPAVGDMAENASRAAWAGAGLMLPNRLLHPDPVRWATRRILGDPEFAQSAGEIAAWSRRHDGAERGAQLVELLADRA